MPPAPYDSFQVVGPCRDSVTPADPACADPTAFIAPFLMDPGNPQRLVAATNKVYLSTNGGGAGGPASWIPISPGLTSGTVYSSIADQITTLFMGPRGDTGSVMTGSRRGSAFLSTHAVDASATWTNITGNLPPFPGVGSPEYAPPNAWISGLTFNPANPSEAWATIGGLGVGHVWHTLNAGATAGTSWTSLDGSGLSGLANVIVDSILLDPASSSTIYVGTDFGVMVCSTCGGPSPTPTWAPLGSGLPSVKVNALSLTHDNRTLFAWTHGRGAWAWRPWPRRHHSWWCHLEA